MDIQRLPASVDYIKNSAKAVDHNFTKGRKPQSPIYVKDFSNLEPKSKRETSKWSESNVKNGQIIVPADRVRIPTTSILLII